MASAVKESMNKITGAKLVKDYVLTKFKVGERLPSEDNLSKKLGTSRYAALKALQDLSEEGCVERKTRSGTFLVSQTPTPRINKNGVSLVAFVADEFKHFSGIISGIEEQYRNDQMAVAVVSSEYNPELEISHLESLCQVGFVGAIIRLSEHTSSVEAIRKLFDSHFPLVLIENKDLERDIPCVQTDNEEAAYKATRYLLELGHRRIAHIAYGGGLAERVQAIPEREAGYRRALCEAKIGVREEYIAKVINYNVKLVPPSVACLTGVGYGYDEMHKLLCLSEPPTAVVSGSHWLGIPAVRAVCNQGLRVPEDVSIVEMGDSEAAQHCLVPLTVMNEKAVEIGKTASQIMEQILHGKKITNKLVKISAELIERNSTAPPKRK